ncbi:MAG: hypothetical protein MAG431_00359 [Chloroflexi bacterium]|nr:hypothetical protein [Chloroflexota bacterium]
MQHRCNDCHMPYTIHKDLVHNTLDKMTKKGWEYYDFKCPHCKKTNRIPKEQLVHAAPTWEYEAEE